MQYQVIYTNSKCGWPLTWVEAPNENAALKKAWRRICKYKPGLCRILRDHGGIYVRPDRITGWSDYKIGTFATGLKNG